MVVFLSTSCPACDRLVPAIPAFRRDFPDIDIVAVVNESDESGGQSAIQEKLRGTRVVRDRLVSLRLGVGIFPYVLFIDANGILRSKGVANTPDHLESLASVLAHNVMVGNRVEWP